MLLDEPVNPEMLLDEPVNPEMLLDEPVNPEMLLDKPVNPEMLLEESDESLQASKSFCSEIIRLRPKSVRRLNRLHL